MAVTLPSERSKKVNDVSKLTMLIYGAPKSGKTTSASQAPGAIFFECEPGLNHLEVFKIPTYTWDDFLAACKVGDIPNHPALPTPQAPNNSETYTVTGPDARAKVHVLRARHDAVAVGIGTAIADDPRLTVRDYTGQSPTRVVFDTKLRLPIDGHLASTARDTRVWVVCGEDAPTHEEEELRELGIDVLRAPKSSEGRVDVAAALALLGQRGIVSLMVEGGAELAGSFLAGRMADDMHAFIAPMLLGPRGRPGAVDWAGPDTPAQAPRIAKPSWELCGADAYVHGRLTYPD